MKKMVLFLSIFFSLLEADIDIYTGYKNGTYFQFGNDLKEIAKIEVNNKTTIGSYANIKALLKNKKDLAIVQHDVLWYLEDHGQKDLKNKIHSLLTLYPEEIHIIVRNNSMINYVKDLDGKRVSAGEKGSGTWITKNYLEENYSINFIDSPATFEKAMTMLYKQEIDAVITIVGIPFKGLKDLPTHLQKNLRLISMEENSKMKKIYLTREIPKNTYFWQKEDIQTYSSIALLVGNNGIDNFIINRIESKIMNSLDRLKVIGHYKWNKVILKDIKIWPTRRDIEKIK